jgi:transcriptional regulator with XRE-family HTH domain
MVERNRSGLLEQLTPPGRMPKVGSSFRHTRAEASVAAIEALEAPSATGRNARAEAIMRAVEALELALPRGAEVMVADMPAYADDVVEGLRYLARELEVPSAAEHILSRMQGEGEEEGRRGKADRLTAGISLNQLAVMADYHRARRGFTTDTELAEVLGVHRTRMTAWKRGRVSPSTENARVLSHVAVVVSELEEFLDPDVIPEWLQTEQYTLGGRTPADALREGRLAEVLYAANATEHGAYV